MSAAARRRKPAPAPEGTILGMEQSHPMSSIGYLILETAKDTETKVICDCKYTNRALLDCFGEVCVIGKKIWYRVDNVGVLSEIGPVGE
jgi:hypothetical protein